MKLSEALNQRKSLTKRIKMDQEALEATLMGPVKAGDQREPQRLLRQIESNHAHLESLVIHIYKANARTILPNGRTLIETIAHKETISKRIEYLKALLGKMAAKSNLEPWPPTRSKVLQLRLTPQILRNEINNLTIELQALERSIDHANASTELGPWNKSLFPMSDTAEGF